MWWRQDQLDGLDDAVSAAVRGRPTVLSIEGDAGQGKTALLRELLMRAPDFHVLRGEGDEETSRHRLRLLDQWGLGRDGTVSRYRAAQELRELLDRLLLSGPVLMALDDLQWIDPESVEAMAWVAQRASGDRLLVAGAARPIRPPAHSAWRRLLLDGHVTTIELDGMGYREAKQMVSSLRPGIDSRLARRLWLHTSGHPLYLRSLLNEHRLDELEAMDILPAPGDLARTLAIRARGLTPEARRLLDSVTVLGPSWVSSPLAAEVGTVDDPTPAVAELVDSKLLDRRHAGVDLQLKVVHSLVRAAVYANIPPTERERLHLLAARRVPSRRAVLRHRAAAADRYDPDLARDLAAFADEVHEARNYREAAHFLHWSSAATLQPDLRERRWLDAVFEQCLARDVEAVQDQLTDVGWASDAIRRLLVQAMMLILTRRWAEAAQTLSAGLRADLDTADSRTRYRFLVLRSWLNVATGKSAHEVLPGLRRARQEQDQDEALSGVFAFAYGQATMTGTSIDEWRPIGTVAPGGPDADRYRVAWRGARSALAGRFDEAVRDLTEVTSRTAGGLAGAGEGCFHALLGYAHWMRGEWARAEACIGRAVGSRFGGLHPLVLAIAPLRWIARGDNDGALNAIGDLCSEAVHPPWPPVVEVATTAAVIVRRLSGTPEERAQLLPQLRHDLAVRAVEVPRSTEPLWLLHLTLAHVWASELETATQLTDRLAVGADELTWAPGAVDWLRGLIHEKAGDNRSAQRYLTTARFGQSAGLPLHHAFLLEDLARVERVLGHTTAADAAQTSAAARLNQLGLPPGVESARITDPPRSAVLESLTDRERDVAALLAEGLSYVQIARELYVTRSTVAFHLSNIYAKTRVSTRHELMDRVRSSSASR